VDERPVAYHRRVAHEAAKPLAPAAAVSQTPVAPRTAPQSVVPRTVVVQMPTAPSGEAQIQVTMPAKTTVQALGMPSPPERPHPRLYRYSDPVRAWPAHDCPSHSPGSDRSAVMPCGRSPTLHPLVKYRGRGAVASAVAAVTVGGRAGRATAAQPATTLAKPDQTPGVEEDGATRRREEARGAGGRRRHRGRRCLSRWAGGGSDRCPAGDRGGRE